MISRICLLSMDKSAEMSATPPIVRKRGRGRPCKGNKNKKNRARFDNRSRAGKTHDVYVQTVVLVSSLLACFIVCRVACLLVGWLVAFTFAFYWYLLLSASVLFVFVFCFWFFFVSIFFFVVVLLFYFALLHSALLSP